MARTGEGTIWSKAGIVVLSATILSSLALAQGNGPAPAPAMPAPFSRDCQVGNTTIASESPLPHVAAALRDKRKLRILAIGASPSVGRRSARGGHTGETRDILQQAIKGLDVEMINRGVSGELAAQAATRIKNEVALHEPDLVLWQVGTNDALVYVPLEEIEQTILETLRWLKERKVDVVLVGLQYVDRMAQDDHYRAIRELIRKVAAQENVIAVRRYEAQRLLAQAAGSGGGLVPDEFQRSEAGYVCLSQYLARAITLGVFGANFQPRELQSTPPARPQN